MKIKTPLKKALLAALLIAAFVLLLIPLLSMPASAETCLEHKLAVSVVEPTATNVGMVTLTCENCTDYKKEYELPVKGSEAYTWTVTRVPLCQAEGVKTATYVVKDSEIEVYTFTYTEPIPRIGHVNADPPVESTWEVEGKLYTGFFCGECEYMIVTHNWGTGTVTQAPTCKDMGLMTYACADCDEILTKPIDKTADHIWGEGEVTTECTSATVGIITYTCTSCGETKQEIFGEAPYSSSYNETTNLPSRDGTTPVFVGGWTAYTTPYGTGVYDYDNLVLLDYAGSGTSNGLLTRSGSTFGAFLSYGNANANYHGKLGTVGASASQVAVIRYTAEHTGKANIYFDLLGNVAWRANGVFTYTVYVNGVQVWPLNGEQNSVTCNNDAKTHVIYNETTLAVSGISLNAGDHVDFVCENTRSYTGINVLYGGGGNAMFSTVAYTEIHTYGEWSKHDESAHAHTCETCGKVEYENHLWNDGELTVQPTETTHGSMTYTCTVCGEIKTESVHIWDDGVVISVPNCETDGSIFYTCTICNETKTEITAATGHDKIGVWIMVLNESANICVDGGQKLYVCKTCFTGCTNCAGKILDTEIIAPEGHNITAEWTVTTAPTFETTGVLAGFCDACGTNATYELPVLGSAYTKTSPVLPSCTSEGTDNYAITVKGWSGSFDVATTTDHVYKGVKMPLDKIYAPSEVDAVSGSAPASCLDASGKGSFICDTCRLEYIVSVRGECEYTEDDVIDFVDSTCSTTGHKTYKCPTCGEEYTVTIPLKDHVYIADPTVTGPDAQNKIVLTFKCDHCSHIKTIICDEFNVAPDPATCTKDGVTTYTYTYTDNSGATVTGTFSITVDALGHSWDNGAVTTAPTCTAAGVKTYTCTVCGETKTETLAKIPLLTVNVLLGDKFSANGKVTIPEGITATEAGLYVDGVKMAGVLTDNYYLVEGFLKTAAKETGKTVTAQAYYIADGVTVKGSEIETSIAALLRNYLNSADEEVVALATATLNYAAAAQVYFGYDVENLVNEGLAATPSTGTYKDNFAVVEANPDATVVPFEIALLLNDTVDLYVKIVDKTGAPIDGTGYILQVSNEADLFNAYGVAFDERGVAVIKGISPSYWNDTYYFRIIDEEVVSHSATFTYGVSTYFARMSETEDASLAALVDAMMALYEANEAYLAPDFEVPYIPEGNQTHPDDISDIF